MTKKHPLSNLDADIRDHLARETQENIERGMPPDEARYAALRKFGNVTHVQENARAVWIEPWIDAIQQDVRYAFRALLRNRAFAAVVILTLAFGIGINTATFSIVNAVLIRPLGFAEPGRLIALHERATGLEGMGEIPFSPPDFLELQRNQQSFESVAAYRSESVELSGSGKPVRIDAARVSANLFSLLGVAPQIGRGFTEAEDVPGIDVAVLSWALWQTRYDGNPAIIGQVVTLDRRPYTVIGIMPRHFEFPSRGPQFNSKPASVWIPIAFTGRQKQGWGDEYNQSVIGRLKDGVSIGEARAELDILARRINASYPPTLQRSGFSTSLSALPLREELAGRVERPLLLLLGAVGLVLLVTCANVANLVLSRLASRRREIAVRTALGSSRIRVLQLLLAEAASLSMAGGLLGILCSQLIVGAMPSVVTETLPIVRNISIDFRVLAFTAAIAAATSIVFAFLPMVTVDRGTPGPALQEETARTTPGRRRHRLQAGLIVSTVTLACVLLIGAGLFIRSFSALMATDSGYKADGVLTAALTLPRAGYSTAASVRGFHDVLLTRTSALPGVRSTALVTDLPHEQYERRSLSVEGAAPSNTAPPSTNLSWVYGAYFETLGIQVKRGRVFSNIENLKPAGVVIINERLAETLWPGEDAVGQRLRWGANVPENQNRFLTVVGVVADVADGPPGTLPHIHAYEPFSQFPNFIWNNLPTLFGRQVKLAVRTNVEPTALAPALRSEIAGIDPQLAIESVVSMNERVGNVVAPRRFSMLTLGAFAAGSLLLAAIGLYGLLVFGIRESRREIAVRLALGADSSSIVWMIVSQGLKLVTLGLVVGIAASFGVARAVASLLYETSGYDLVAFSAAPIVLVATALLACALPAYRASRVDPTTALRTE